MKIGGLNRSIGAGNKVGCVLALDLKRKDGDSFMDRSVFGHLCTNHGSKWQLDGRYFNGSSDYIGVSPAGSLPDFKTTLAWIKLLSVPADWTAIVNKTTAGSYLFALQAGGKLEMYLRTTLLEGGAGETKSPLPLGLGLLTGATYDGADVRYYIQGDLDDTKSFAGGSLKKLLYDYQIGGQTGYTRWFHGNIREILTYSFADYTPRILSRSIGG